MGTQQRVIAGHQEGQAIFRISTYPALRGRTLQRHHVSCSFMPCFGKREISQKAHETYNTVSVEAYRV